MENCKQPYGNKGRHQKGKWWKGGNQWREVAAESKKKSGKEGSEKIQE